MQTFRVTWEIDIEADTATEAAARALAIMRDNDPLNTATVFTCVDPECEATVVDLDEEDGGLS
ncbi:hypothetical protein [Ruegeria sp. HKCCD8929]|uniref:hypothetical protein n=1 Tax=Ruegeria sp. HKCCD8929 TaxID=2683006 RepID=UPI001488CAED|nr:hypothetical protein [Ruegeria sp. HKCCD8929]